MSTGGEEPRVGRTGEELGTPPRFRERPRRPSLRRGGTVASVARFAAVGLLNTGVDFVLLNVLIHLGLRDIVANTISTGTAMLVSFVLNKQWTFGNHERNYLRQLALFLSVTLFGLWVVQNGVMSAILALWQPNLPGQLWANIAKLVASPFSLTWNFLLYRRVVFRADS